MKWPPKWLASLVFLMGCFKTGEEESSSQCVQEVRSRTISWDSDIQGLVQQHCQNCHGSTPQPPATQNLTNKNTLVLYYSDAHDVNGPGLLIRLTTNNQRMPPDGSLSPCDVEKFKKWQEDGFP
ncbi:MAG: hypothetical protein NZM25_05130 [Leptospiraceae bacterium]|nr:hypothetical protein [Leptospiraceae bacterium]